MTRSDHHGIAIQAALHQPLFERERRPATDYDGSSDADLDRHRVVSAAGDRPDSGVSPSVGLPPAAPQPPLLVAQPDRCKECGRPKWPKHAETCLGPPMSCDCPPGWKHLPTCWLVTGGEAA